MSSSFFFFYILAIAILTTSRHYLIENLICIFLTTDNHEILSPFPHISSKSFFYVYLSLPQFSIRLTVVLNCCVIRIHFWSLKITLVSDRWFGTPNIIVTMSILLKTIYTYQNIKDIFLEIEKNIKFT